MNKKEYVCPSILVRDVNMRLICQQTSPGTPTPGSAKLDTFSQGNGLDLGHDIGVDNSYENPFEID